MWRPLTHVVHTPPLRWKCLLPTLLLAAISLTVMAPSLRSQPPTDDAPPTTETPATETPPPEVDVDFKADILELIDQLDGSRLVGRQTAEQELIKKGPSALPFLPEDPGSLSAEARLRLRRVRAALEKKQARVETKNIVVRLNGAKTLEEALEKISAASGVSFEHGLPSSTPIELGTSGPLSFWQALDTVLDAANLDIDFYGGGESKLALVPRQENRPRRIDSGAYTGVYRLEPTMVTARRVLNNPQLSGLQISIQVAWEPRLTPIGLSLPLNQIQATLDDGTTLTPLSTEGEILIATNSELAFSEIGLPLQLPTGRPRKISTLNGMIEALIPGPQHAFEFPLAKGKADSTVGSVTVEIDAIRPNGTLHEVRMLMKLGEANRSLESHQQWVFDNPAFVTASDGTRREHLGYQLFRQTGNEIGIGYLFDLGENVDDFTFHYKTPTGIVPTKVPFVIPEILLP